jgi:hypothetical protein
MQPYVIVCHWLIKASRFSFSISVSSNNKTHNHFITEILLKVVLIIHNPYHILCKNESKGDNSNYLLVIYAIWMKQKY